ncbi:MAG: hypothetical protein SGI89_04570 [bacterium]|nr:hypothetical protein [bacterium]
MKSQDLQFVKRIKPEMKKEIEKNYQKLLNQRKLQRAKKELKITNALNELNKLSKPIIGKNELKLYEHLYSKHKIECENERIKYLGNGSDNSKIVSKHKSAFSRELEKNIPGLKKLLQKRKQLVSKYLNEEKKPGPSPSGGIVKGILAGRFEIFEKAIFLDPTAINNKPPYTFIENRIDIVFDEFNTLDYDSIADVDSGLIIHNIKTYHVDNAWFTHKAAKYEAYAGFGVNYTMPKTGTVSVDVFIQNLYNKNLVSITDNFGASEGWADLENKLYMNILHPSNIAPFEIELNKMDLHSDGDEVIRNDINKIDTEFAKWINFRSTGSFVEGTNLQIIVGNKEMFYNILDDMQCSSETLYSWFVRNIIVRTV